MMVARSPAEVADTRSRTTSSPTGAPSAARVSRPGALSPAWSVAPPAAVAAGPASMRQTCSRALSRSRSPETILSCAAVSTKIALAPESLMIHSTCSAEDVS